MGKDFKEKVEYFGFINVLCMDFQLHGIIAPATESTT